MLGNYNCLALHALKNIKVYKLVTCMSMNDLFALHRPKPFPFTVQGRTSSLSRMSIRVVIKGLVGPQKIFLFQIRQCHS